MIITGTAIFVQPGTSEEVVEKLKSFPQVTFHVKSESGTELVVNLEAEDHDKLEQLCEALKSNIPEIVEIVHLSANFEEMVAKMESGEQAVRKPKFGKTPD